MGGTRFDEDEAIILVAYYMDSAEGRLNRRDAIVETSKELKERAGRSGIIVPGNFRSIYGITLQFAKLDSIYYGKECRLSKVPRLYFDIMKTYRLNKAQFDSELRIAKSSITHREVADKADDKDELVDVMGDCVSDDELALLSDAVNEDKKSKEILKHKDTSLGIGKDNKEEFLIWCQRKYVNDFVDNVECAIDEIRLLCKIRKVPDLLSVNSIDAYVDYKESVITQNGLGIKYRETAELLQSVFEIYEQFLKEMR